MIVGLVIGLVIGLAVGKTEWFKTKWAEVVAKSKDLGQN